MDLNLKGKKALVTGASAGLGAAAAMALVSEGAEVIINSRSEQNLQAAAEKIASVTGTIPSILAADLSVESDLDFVAEHVKKLQPIDILVSNTGGPPPGMFLDHDLSVWPEAGRLLLDSAIKLTHMVLPDMIERQWGRLIYITSIAVLQPVDTLILSNTYRAGVTGFCKTVSNNYAKDGITANCVCPGYTATERLHELAENLAGKSGSTPEQVMEGFAEATPARRLGDPVELASLISFLASDRAAYITGSSIAVDGGLNKALV